MFQRILKIVAKKQVLLKIVQLLAKLIVNVMTLVTTAQSKHQLVEAFLHLQQIDQTTAMRSLVTILHVV